jgi:hypothetical protein
MELGRVSSKRAAVVWTLMAVVVAAGCSAAHTPTRPPTARNATLTPTPWRTIHPTDNRRIMLIDLAQDTDNPRDACWSHSAARVTLRNGAFYVGLRQGTPGLPRNVSCAALAIKGPFYATVHLPQPYHGEPLIDTFSGQTHRPSAVVKLMDAPKRFR